MSDKNLYLEVVTPYKTLFSGYVKSVTVPGELGSFQILYNHAPIISNLTIGEVKFIDLDGSPVIFATNGGFVRVINNRITIISDSLTNSKDINLEKDKAHLAKLKEEIKLKRKTENVEELEKRILQLENRIRIASKLK